MSVIREWATHWKDVIPVEAIMDLEKKLGLISIRNHSENTSAEGSESRQQSLIRLEAARKDIYLTRNNVGSLTDSRGVPVRYGLANESKQINRRFKSGDLIGIEKIRIKPCHIGIIFGRFISVECKDSKWKLNKNDPHTKAQLAWQEHVISYGGRAIFANEQGLL